MRTPIIRNQDFILRPPALSDAQDFVAALNNVRVSRYMKNIPYPYTSAIARAWLKKQTRRRLAGQNEPGHYFVIEKDGRAIGLVSLSGIKEKHEATFGYWLAPEYWGRGLMTKAVRLVADFGFKRLKLRRIQAYVFKSNPASVKVLEKNNFKKEGLLKKARFKDGHFFDAYLLAKVK
jgi:RimJ/RimL family protein N-acetyltransferase